eukprot:jgi/Picsp_1/6631/NSC_03974-R1_domain-containing histone demethylation protein 1
MGRRKLSSLLLSKGGVDLDDNGAHKGSILPRRASKRQRRQIQLEEKVCMDDSVLDAVDGLRAHVDVKAHRNKLESLCKADDIEATEPANLYQEMMEDGFRSVRVVRGNTDRCIDEVRADLCMHIPTNTCSLDGLEKVLSGYEDIPTIDVEKQEEGPSMSFLQLKEYFSKPRRKRDRLLNVVSFNLGDTEYGNYIVPPVAVRDLDLATRAWPASNSEAMPNTLTYLLMGPAGAYTDWHVDMGGSSVWYHVVSGCKVFLAAPPTDINRNKFLEWSTTMSQSEFLGDSLRGLVRIKLRPGDTLFLPGGWFHAVSTPEDSIVVGGNFVCPLHYENIFHVIEIEKKLRVKADFQYPQHQKLIYYAAGQLLGKIRKAQSSRQQLWCKGISKWEIEGFPYLIKYLERALCRYGHQKTIKDVLAEADIEAIVEALKLQWQCLKTRDVVVQKYDRNHESVERVPFSETPSSAATREAGYEEMAVDASVHMDKSLSSSQEPAKDAETEKRKDDTCIIQKTNDSRSQDGFLAASLRDIITPPLMKYNVDEEDRKTISEIKRILAKSTKLNASCSLDVISDGDESSLKLVEEADAPASPEEKSLPVVSPPKNSGPAEHVAVHQVEPKQVPHSPVSRKPKHGLKPRDLKKGVFLREKPSAEPTPVEKARLAALQRYASTSQGLQPLSRQGSKKMDLCSKTKVAASTPNVQGECSWNNKVVKILKELKTISHTAKKELIILDNVKHGKMKLSDNGARIKQKMNELIVTWRHKANTLHSTLQKHNKASEMDSLLHDEAEKELVTMDDVMVRCQSACGVSPGSHQRLVLSPRRSPSSERDIHNHHDKRKFKQDQKAQPRKHSNLSNDKDKSTGCIEKPGAARSLKPVIDSASDIDTLASWYLGDTYLGPYSKSDLRAMYDRGETTLFTFVHSHDGTVTMSLKSLLGPGIDSHRTLKDPSGIINSQDRSAKLQASPTSLKEKKKTKNYSISGKQVEDKKKNVLTHSEQGRTCSLPVPSFHTNNVSRTPSPAESFIPVGNAPDCIDQNNQTESDEGGSETFSLAADKKPANLTDPAAHYVQNQAVLFNYRDAAIAVLTAQNQFMTPHEIVKEALRLNMIVPKGKTPAATMASRLLYDTKKAKNIFVSDNTGKFGLKAWLA